MLYRFNSDVWNEYEVIDFEDGKTFTLKRLNGDYYVKYTMATKKDGTEFEYYEWANNGDLDPMNQSALELLKECLEN